MHIDNPENIYANDLLLLIDTFNLTEHVQGPTHSHGHTLDLVITKGLNITLAVKDLALSDHFCISFGAVFISPQIQNSCVIVRKRIRNDHTGALFEHALLESLSLPSDSVENLMDNFNSKMGNIMDHIAPFKLKKKANEKQKSPLKLNPIVNLLKRECRQTERKWRKSKLPIHLQIHKEMQIKL